MAADQSRYILSRLFVAIPEIRFDSGFLRLLQREGLVSDADIETMEKVRRRARKTGRIVEDLKNKSLIERLLVVAPELMSVATINFLRKYDLIDAKTGNALRVGLRAGKSLYAGQVSSATILERMAGLGGSILSFNTINLLRDLDNEMILQIRNALPETAENRAFIRELFEMSVARAQVLRSVLSTGRLSAETLAMAKEVDGIWDVITVFAESILSDKMLKNAIRVGALSQEKYELIRALERLGLNVWKKGLKGFQDYDSFMARGLLLSEGILSPEMIAALRSAGLITDELATLLYPTATAIRRITRHNLKSYVKGIRIRVIPGEAPIKSFARIGQATDKEILKLLSEAARLSRKEAEALAKTEKFGNLTRAAQKRILENALHLQMRAVWEGVGHLTIFGEKESARAALASMDFLQNRLWKDTSKAGAEFRRAMQRQAEAGIDAYISRYENLNPLSRRVYKNMALAQDLVSRRVNLGLLRGLSAKELANDVSSLIRPGVRGGVSYSAMRLARTEINNAFHFSSIRYTREMPWVDGYKWNLSGSHPHVDVCNTMAQTNHDGIGRGVYKKGNVPGKPHPNCFCYITTVTDSNAEFERKLRTGAYSSYFKQLEKQGSFPEANRFENDYSGQARQIAVYAGTAVAASVIKTASSNIGEIRDALNG